MAYVNNSDDVGWPSMTFNYCKSFQMWLFVQLCMQLCDAMH